MSGRSFARSIATFFLLLPSVGAGIGFNATVASATSNNSLQPYSWGGVAPTSDSKKQSVWGSLAMPLVGTSSLTASSPNAGGSATATTSLSSPTGKLSSLRSFNGAVPQFISEGSVATHALAAVISPTGEHQVWAWGTNTYGQLGIGSTTSIATPVQISWTASADEEIIYLATGASHSLMVTNTSGVQKVYAWGLNTSGQLGDGSLTNRLIPTRITFEIGTTIVSIAGGSSHSVAADANGKVWVWGCDGAQIATSLACGDLGLYGSRFVVVPTKLTDSSVNTTSTAITNKSYVHTTNIATFKLSVPAGIAIGDPVALSVGDSTLNSNFQQVEKVSRSSTTVTLIFSSPHGRSIGDKIYARGMSVVHSGTTLVQITDVSSPTTLQFTTSTSGTVSETTISTAYIFDVVAKTASVNTIGPTFTTYATQSKNSAATGPITYLTSSVPAAQKAIPTTTTAQIFFNAAHPFIAGNSVSVSGVGAPWDGTFTISSTSNSVGAYWIKYTIATQGATMSATDATQGSSVAFSTPSHEATAVSYAQASNLVTITTATNNTLKPGNLISVDLDDNRYDKSSTAVVSATTTSFSYYLNASIASTNISGSVTVIGCFESCPTAPSGVLEVSAGQGFTVARTTSAVVSWGTAYTNHYGRLGRTSPTSTATTRFGTVTMPLVDGGSTCVPVEITAAVATAAVRCDVVGKPDTVVAWGHAYQGRTGAGTTNVTTSSLAQATPAEVTACLTCANNGNTTTLGASPATSGSSQNSFVTLGHALAPNEEIVQIEMNTAGGYARTSANRILSWGANTGRILGTTRYFGASDGSTKEEYSKSARVAQRVVPIAADGSASPISTMGSDGTCAYVIDSTGVMWSWGYCATSYLSARGTTGYLTYASRTTTSYGLKFDRIDVPSTARIISIESMYRYTFILINSGDSRNDVSLWAVGNTVTQVGTSGYYVNYPGDSSSSSYLLPAKIDVPFGFDMPAPDDQRTIATLSCGEMHCLATTSDAKVYGWGDVRTSSNSGALMPAQPTTTYTYTSLTDLTSSLTTAMGVSSFSNPRVSAGSNFSLIVDIGSGSTGGAVWGWGQNAGRRASTGTSTLTVIQPTRVSNASNPSSHTTMSDIVSISAGSTHSVAIRSNGSVVVWGSDAYGQLGDGTTTGAYFSSPRLPAGRVAVQAIAAGGYTMIRLDNGSVVSFGLNKRGVLGNGNAVQQISPVAISGNHTFSSIDTNGSLFSDSTHSAVGVTSSGLVYAWGSNDYGQLGRGGVLSSTTYSSVPVPVLTDTGTQVSGVDSVVSTSYTNSAFTRFEPLQRPVAPTSLSATSSDSSVTLSWTAPNPFREILNYRITATGGGQSVVISAGAGETSKIITGLTNGASYTIAMNATNRVGDSETSSSITATPSTTPQAPASLNVQPTTQGITATWASPSDNGGSSVLDYAVKIFEHNADISTAAPVFSSVTELSNVAATTANGLTIGTSYDIYVWSRNANGLSTLPNSASAIVPGRPSSPINIQAVGGSGSIDVSWAAPLSDGGFPIFSYVVRTYNFGSSTAMSTVVLNASTFSTSVSSLIDGSTYEVTVTASQAGGPTDSSSAIAAQGSESLRYTAVAGRPLAPTITAVTESNASLTVTWQVVPDVPGVTVTHYVIKAVGTSTVTSPAISAASLNCTTTCTSSISPLINGTSYQVSVAAGVGSSVGSFGLYGASDEATPRTTPSSPQNLQLAGGDTSIDVSWDPPSSDGGAEISAYELTLVAGSTTINKTFDELTLATSVSGLTNGTTYSVSVVAVNEAGNSATPLAGTQKALTTPSAPNVTTIGPATTTLTTQSISSDGSVATLTFASATNLLEGNVVDISGLTDTFNGTDVEIIAVTSSPYTISYNAFNDMVVSSTTTSAGTVRLAGIYVEWDSPNNGGDAISAYNISVSDGNSSTTYVVKTSSVTLADGSTNATAATTSTCSFNSRSCTISKIETLDDAGITENILFSNGSTYTISIAAVNNAGIGSSVDPSIVVGQPNMPTSVSLAPSESRFTACWSAPNRIPTGRSIQGYRITATHGGVSSVKTVTTDEVSASTSCTSPQLGIEVNTFDDGTSPARGTQYSVSISATVSSMDTSPTFGGLSQRSIVTPHGVPDAPAFTGIIASGTTAQLTWAAPTNTGGRALDGYIVTSIPSGFGCTAVAASCTISGLSPGQSYRFRVVAVNQSGESTYAESLAVNIASESNPTTLPTTTAPSMNAPTPTPTTVPAVVASNPWTNVKTKGSIGGMSLVSSTAGSSASFSVKSRTITVWFRTGPTSGKVVVKVNGKIRKTVDLWSKKSGSRAVTVTSTTKSKTSLLTISVSSSRNAKSKGRLVQFDAYSITSKCAKGCVKNPSVPR
jgi:alpha-tubulin suppressor-like RCC1 family protein